MLTQKIISKFNDNANNGSIETHEHFATFYHYGKNCKRIVEMGVLHGWSCWAWLACNPDYLRGVDVDEHNRSNITEIEEAAVEAGIDFKFELADTSHGKLKYIEENFRPMHHIGGPGGIYHTRPPYIMEDNIDMLYIDTYHSYTQLRAELFIHGPKVKKYISFHDTAKTAYGEHCRFDGDKGLNYAIDEFMEAYPNWRKIFSVEYRYGCTVIANTDNVDDPVITDSEYRFPMPDLTINN